MKKCILGIIIGVCLSFCTVAFADDTIQAYLFPAKFNFNGQDQVLPDDYTVLNYNGHAYVPIRFLAESMGANIDYLADKNEIVVKSGPLDITDPDVKYVHIGNLIVTKEGDQTKVSGLLQMDFAGMLGANLAFYNDKDEKLGFVYFNQNYEQGIQKFELTGDGDFTNYAKVSFHIGYLR